MSRGGITNAFRVKPRGTKASGMNTKMYNELVKRILDVLGDRVLSIILYGSSARGTDSPESDIDVAIIVRSALSNAEEDALSDAVVDLDLKYDKVFSLIDIEDEKIKVWGNVIPFYKNVKREGIVLWKAA